MQVDNDKIKEFLDSAIRQIRTEEDPKALNEYRKAFRKNVSLSLRSYFAAYMIKAALEGGARPQARRQGAPKERQGYLERGAEKKGRQAEGATRQGARSARPVLSEDEASTIFISIGKNRNVYPKDIIYIIMQNSGIERAHIGEIKILESYTFAQVAAPDAQKVIDALSGIEYRGKKLSASFAKKAESYAQDAPQAESPFPAADPQ